MAAASRAEVIALPHAAPIFERASVAFRAIEDDADPGSVADSLDRSRPDVLVTGTSRHAGRDAAWWDAASSRGIPTLAVLDHWDHYVERFTVRRPFDRLPSRVAVMDERARRALVGSGCPPERLVVTGQPALEAVLEAPLVGGEAARQGWGVTGADRVILFVSEPLASDYGGAHPYDETQALAILLEAAAYLRARIVVRPHPRQSPNDMGPDIARVTIDRTPSPRAAMAGADTITGMTSIFLLEAALAGAPVLSIQPSGDVYPIGGDCPDLIAIARTVSAARAWLMDPDHQRRLLGPERVARNRKCGFVPGATARVLHEIERLRLGR